MINKVLDAIKKFSLLQKGDDVTVALSGGADSVSLLYALLSIKDELGITVNAAHLNHLIRGEEAERDQNFVTDLCEKLGVTLFCEKSDVPKIAKENGISLELAARQVRYEFL
jgi:tRNA(Ile)-lysidine synthase